MNKLTVGSLFSGIGGLELGLEMTGGFKTIWQVEIDEYATKVLEKHWPDVTRFRDIRECGKHNLAAVDLICGGFPCQDISDAGKRAGITGKRSGLWTEYYRIICELRPRFIIVENVPALLKRGVEVVLGDLATCGYDAEWQMLPAHAFGASHIRERLFIVAYPHENQYTHQCFSTIDRSNNAQAFQQWTKSLHELGAMPGCTRSNTYSRIRREFYGISRGMDRLGCLGNAVVPQVAQFVGECILAREEMAGIA